MPTPLTSTRPARPARLRRALARVCTTVLAAVAAISTASVATLLCAPPAHAGQDCEQRPLKTQELIQGLNMAEATARALDASGAEVVVLARAGQDLRRWNLQWSHMGLAYRVSPPNTKGQVGTWRIVHKLNHCGTPSSGLYRQGLGEFFMDQPWRYAAAFSVLHADVQNRLLPVLRDNTRTAALHTASYNMLAYPWSTQHQQSNQWVLETMVAALSGLDSRGGAQTMLNALGYQPGLLEIGAMTRLGANLTRANLTFEDQPFGERMAGRIRTVTAESVFAWLVQTRLGAPVQVVP